MKSLAYLASAAAALALAAPQPAVAGSANAAAMASEEALADLYHAAGTTDLAAGDYRWFDGADVADAATIVVDLSEQMAFVYDGHRLVGVSTVSTGKRGHETPTGSFEILQKREEHYSNLYDDAPMPFMQRLTWDGIALHAGAVKPEPASHGCVRLPYEFAQALFDKTDGKTMVHIVA
ncbi:L,D-transpeptidase family protein [Sphingomicrobium arenosum]|uniref:L,D-transpeptidase family protein n=1 Tax=Sphingomicrobium arenosum TaxID=2233861 RepID=UPI00223FDD18|nr:L,D-transpeptidase family protein [Sphingomicrobium arenosum]